MTLTTLPRTILSFANARELEQTYIKQAHKSMMMQHDLRLILGGDESVQTEIMAFSQIMINASPVFGAMLNPDSYLEGIGLSRDKHLELPLPDDNTEAMNILCNILHLQPRKVPTTTITPDQLDNIATLVDKYGFTRAIQPWPKIWFQQEHIQTELNQVDNLQVDTLPKWAHICCSLGYSRHFEILTSALTARACLDDFTQSSFAVNFAKLPLIVQGE